MSLSNSSNIVERDSISEIPTANALQTPGLDLVGEWVSAPPSVDRHSLEDRLEGNIIASPVADQVPPQSALVTAQMQVTLSSKPYLLGLPLEVRDNILGLCLHNPDLGTPASLPSSGRYIRWELDKNAKYNLTPAIMRVCKQLYIEGTRILYEAQPFYMSIIPKEEEYHCPLIRYDTRQYLWNNPALKPVKRWAATLGTFVHERDESYARYKDVDTNRNRFREFCRTVCQTTLLSLDIKIVPYGVERNIGAKDYADIHKILEPLKLFRNLRSGALKIHNAKDADIIGGLKAYEGYKQTAPNVLSSALESLAKQDHDELQSIVQSGTPVELLVPMYTALVRYSQAYERQPCFKANMAEIRCRSDFESRQGCGREICRTRSPYQGKEEYENEEREEYDQIEQALNNAFKAMFQVDEQSALTEFKRQRAIAIYYLKHQFSNIRNANTNMIDFIKEEKFKNRLFDPSKDISAYGGPFEGYFEGAVAVNLIHDYAKALDRRQWSCHPDYVRARLLIQKGGFDFLYYNMPRETLLRELDAIQKFKEVRTIRVRPIMRELIDDLEDQYVDIFNARMELFRCDIDQENMGVDIPLQGSTPLGRICWDETEWIDMPYPKDEKETKAEEAGAAAG